MSEEQYSLKITVGDTAVEASATNAEVLYNMIRDGISRIVEIKKARSA